LEVVSLTNQANHEHDGFSNQSSRPDRTGGHSGHPSYREPNVSMLFVSVDRVRARYAATMPGPDRPHDVAWLTRVLASLRDIPLLVTELVQLRRGYADLVAACRAGLVARHDGQSEESAWRYITDELPPAPLGHPLHTTSTTGTASTATGGGASD
jgi:hypothetical protein